MIAAPQPRPEDIERWKALAERDSRADGRFVYAVRSTGIYCRPSCPARRARPEQIVFYASCTEAERAGFRACQRCRPNGPSSAERDSAIVARACALIEAAEEAPSLQVVAGAVGMSASHFHRLFKRVIGVTPKEYAAAKR